MSLLLKGFVGVVVVFSPCDLAVSFGKCSIKNRLGSSRSFFTFKFLNCLTVPAVCRHYADKGAIVS